MSACAALAEKSPATTSRERMRFIVPCSLKGDLAAQNNSIRGNIRGRRVDMVDLDIGVVELELDCVVRIPVQPHTPYILFSTENAAIGGRCEGQVVEIDIAITCAHFPGSPAPRRAQWIGGTQVTEASGSGIVGMLLARQQIGQEGIPA